jgi:hypothetical protein
MEEYLLPQVQATFRTQAGTKALRSVSPKTPLGYTGVGDAEKVKPRFEYRLLNLANAAPLSPATFNLKLRKLGLGYSTIRMHCGVLTYSRVLLNQTTYRRPLQCPTGRSKHTFREHAKKPQLCRAKDHGMFGDQHFAVAILTPAF